MVFIKLRVESTPVTNPNRGDAQSCEPRISHPPHVASRDTITPIQSQRRRSQPYVPDYEKALPSLASK